MPVVIQLPFTDKLVGPVSLVLSQMALLASVAAYMFLQILKPHETITLAVVAVVGMCGVVSAGLSLERALVVMRRERPAVVAGLMWIVGYCLTIIICVVQEFVLFRQSDDLDDNQSEWKWSLPLCFVVSMALAVGALVASGRCGPCTLPHPLGKPFSSSSAVRLRQEMHQ